MTIKSILVPIHGDKGSRDALDMALAIAKEHLAHVDALYVRVDPKDTVPLIGEGMSAALIDDLFAAAERESLSAATASRQVFDAACQAAGVTPGEPDGLAPGFGISWIDITGRIGEEVASRGRMVDLIVLPKLPSDSDAASLISQDAAISETGRSVLVVPPGLSAGGMERIVIAWNGSTEAVRAVAQALPFIEKARNIKILSVNSNPHALDDRSLLRYLKLHGITGEIECLSMKGAHDGEAVLAACERENADLLVMGAYTHSRLRQLVMGGVTRHVLEHTEVLVLMAH